MQKLDQTNPTTNRLRKSGSARACLCAAAICAATLLTAHADPITVTTDTATEYAGTFSVGSGQSDFLIPATFPHFGEYYPFSVGFYVADTSSGVNLGTWFFLLSFPLETYPHDPNGTTYTDQSGSFLSGSDPTMTVDWTFSSVQWEDLPGTVPVLALTGDFSFVAVPNTVPDAGSTLPLLGAACVVLGWINRRRAPAV